MMNDKKLLTPTDVANRLKVSERTVTVWLRKGHLRGFKIGKEWRVSVEDLEAFLEASRSGAPLPNPGGCARPPRYNHPRAARASRPR